MTMTPKNYFLDKELEREKNFSPIIEKVLAQNAEKIHESGIKIFEIKKSSPEDDMQKGFDFVFTMGNFTVPVRIRKPTCRFRDFTVRSMSRLGGKTEIHKLKEGAGDVYFYAWCKHIENKEVIDEWWLVNVHNLRNSGLLETERKEIPNYDGTMFIAFKYEELKAYDCIIATSRAA